MYSQNNEENHISQKMNEVPRVLHEGKSQPVLKVQWMRILSNRKIRI